MRNIRAVLFLALGCSAVAADPVRLSGRAMGTTWAVAFTQPAAPIGSSELSRRVSQRLEELEQAFSTYRADSELSRFNAANTTDWVPVSREVAFVAEESRTVSVLTEGAFDPTVEPLVCLWGFGSTARTSLPSTSEIASARVRVGWRKVETRTKPPALRRTAEGVRADFSSMAKGFASDVISELLTEAGATRNFVQIGGDVRTGGGDALAWQVGVEEPIAGESKLACVIALRGGAVSTSGDYRNHFLYGGRRYGHIIDPRTGEPVSNDLASVCVIASTCARSSALATGLFVLGRERGWELARREGLACAFFVREGNAIRRVATPEFERVIVSAFARR